MKRNIWIGIGIVVFVAFAILLNVTQIKKELAVIKIGAILPLTGDAAKWGETSKNGINLAMEEINKAGGINGMKVKIIYEDDQGRVKAATDAMTKLSTVDKVPLVIGTLFSSATLAIAPIAEKNKVVLLSPASTAPKITEAGDYIFRNCASDIFEGKAMSHFAHDTLNLKKIAVIYINNDYGVGLKNVFEAEFQRSGGKIVVSESFEQGATDFRTQLTKIKASNPEAIYMPGYPPEMARILRQAKELGIITQFLSIVIFEDPKILEIAGNAAEGTIFSSRVYDPKSEETVVRKFVDAYIAKYGSEPDIYAGLAYDAMKIAALAIERGRVKSDGIKKSLYGVKDFPGVTGTTTLDKNGDVMKPIRMKILKNGKYMWYKRR